MLVAFMLSVILPKVFIINVVRMNVEAPPKRLPNSDIEFLPIFNKHFSLSLSTGNVEGDEN
jgi:hypothetical protein